jgi:predicted ATPase
MIGAAFARGRCMSDGDAPRKQSPLEPGRGGIGNPARPPPPAAIERAGFFGRTEEIEAVTAAFAGGWRLVTLAGPPGVGKTRLARRVAQELERLEQSPVPFVDLSDVHTRDGFIAAVAAALGVSLAAEARGSALTAVGRALSRAGRPLLVLDNLEQLAEHFDVVAAWLDGAPSARLLVTSRARLRLPAERIVEVGPLSVAAGIALFEERARGPLGRSLSDEELAAVERVVRRLEGIPLSIELAAGRMAVLGVPDVLARLERGLDVLHTTAPGVASARHHSARAAVAWSWELLTEPERRALLQATVFRGGFVLESAEAVLDLPRGEVMDTIQALRERSLLWARRERGGAVRFGLFEIVRDFTRALLEDAPVGSAPGSAADVILGDVEERHARAFARRGAELAARAAAADDPGAATDALEALAGEAENLEAAIAAAREDELVATLALVLATVFRRRGARAVHEEVLQRGLQAARGCGRRDLEADLLQARAVFASAAGEIEIARGCQDRAFELAEEVGDASRRAFARARRGWDRFELGDVEGGLQDMRLAVDEAVRLRDAAREAYARNRLGLAHFHCGSPSSGLEELSRAATLAGQTRDRWLRQKTLVELAWAHRRLGAIEPAAQRLLELASLGAAADGATEAAIRLEHAALARASSRPDDALRVLEEATARADDAGALRHRVLLRVERAAALLDLGRAAEAIAALDEALALAGRVQSAIYRAAVLLELARARQELADPEGARAALDLADIALAAGKDAVYTGAVLVERAILAAQNADPRARATAEEALAVLQRIGGKPLVIGLAVSGLVDQTRSAERRSAAEALLPRFADADARAAVGVLRGQPCRDVAVCRRLLLLRGGRQKREMIIGSDGRYYELDGQRVSLQRQRSLRLILMALVEQAERAPGVGLTQVEVLARGWPGERMRADSGATRVYTSIRRLRRGGLSGVLLTRDDGYLLDPSIAVRRTD